MNVNIFGDTNIGKKRDNNEDAFLAQSIWDDQHFLCVVIDGVGGHDGGEIAAEIAKDTILDYLTRYPNGEMLSILKLSVNEANNRIFKERKERPEYGSMSCVLTACLVDLPHLKVYMSHVGDTRLYKFYSGKLIKLSHDHSLVGYREEIGELTEDQAMNHPQRNIIGRDVGSELHNIDDEDFIETGSFSFRPGTSLLLCSDGLCDMVTSDDMVYILNSEINTECKVEALIDKANANGGNDNITTIIVDFDTVYSKESFENEPADINIIIESYKKNIIKEESNIDNFLKKESKRQKIYNILKKRISINRYHYYVSLLAFGIIGICLGWFSKEVPYNSFRFESVNESSKNNNHKLKYSLGENDTVLLNYDTIFLKNSLNFIELKTIWVPATTLYIDNQNLNKRSTVIYADSSQNIFVKYYGLKYEKAQNYQSIPKK